jgi:glycogen operon protein
MHVDGFRFDLARCLPAGGRRRLRIPIVERIAEDPALRDTKIIAEAWDAAGTTIRASPASGGPNGTGRTGRQRLFRTRENPCSEMGATRIAGSSDLYDRNDQTPLKSINFVTCHDGFTLRDLTSYAKKHNQANTENNQDGENRNFSCNYGREGPSGLARLESLRKRQMKNMLATLFLSQGVPMLLAGDEIGPDTERNNNAYCQATNCRGWTGRSGFLRDLRDFVGNDRFARPTRACDGPPF